MPFVKTRSRSVARLSKRGAAPAGFFSAAFRRFLHSISPRVVDIIAARYGAGGKEPMTLEEIGRAYGITRERVRQIVSGLLRDVSGKRVSQPLEEVAKKLEWTLEKRGGILEEERFFSLVAKDNAKERGAIRFFIAVLSSRLSERETEEMLPSIASESFDESLWKATHRVAIRALSDNGASFDERELLVAIRKETTLSKMSDERILDFLSISKRVKRSVFGRWGFPEWSDIRPRGTKERAYLVLQAEGKPLHFREIAQKIDSKGLQKPGRKTHPQTVHNELIKDKRFVLVGRGTYALVEWGYRRGTVREVIEHILETRKKPVSREELISEVLKLRDVKEATVVINLNNFFERVGNSYRLKSAKA